MAYTYSLVAPSPHWLTIATVNNQGVITGDRAQVPATGYQGFYRVRAWDGINEEFIEGPIDLGPRVDGAGLPLYGQEAIGRSVITIGADIDQSTISTPFVPLSGATVITIGLQAGVSLISTQITTGGGGGAGDDMVMDYQVSGARLSTKPTTAGAADAVINAVRVQSFADQSEFGLGNNAIAATNGDSVECKITRNAIWHSRVYFSAVGNSQEWLLAAAGEIIIEINKINGSIIAYWWSTSPTNLGIVPDGEGQIATITQFNPAASGTKAGYSRWVAYRTSDITAMPTGIADQYWDWQAAGQSQWSN
jgi:hypothetical protein